MRNLLTFGCPLLPLASDATCACHQNRSLIDIESDAVGKLLVQKSRCNDWGTARSATAKHEARMVILQVGKK